MGRGVLRGHLVKPSLIHISVVVLEFGWSVWGFNAVFFLQRLGMVFLVAGAPWQRTCKSSSSSSTQKSWSSLHLLQDYSHTHSLWYMAASLVKFCSLACMFLVTCAFERFRWPAFLVPFQCLLLSCKLQCQCLNVAQPQLSPATCNYLCSAHLPNTSL